MVMTKLITADELIRFPEDYHCELIRGVVREVSPTGPVHARTVGRLLRALFQHDIEGKIGEVWSAETGYELEHNPDTVLAPDIAVVRHTDVAAIRSSDRGYATFAPLLVIEVQSPGNSEAEIADKTATYLRAGVGEVWWVRPTRDTVARFTADGETAVFGRDDTLTSTVLPGFELALVDLFGD